MVKKRTSKPQIQSGATGGAALGMGIAYQIDYTIFLALELISRSLVSPHKNWVIGVEPRAIGGEIVTRWDINISHPDTLIEAKAAPRRSDIIDWLKRMSDAAINDTQKRFMLVHDRDTPLLSSVNDLIRISKECGDDWNRIEKLAQMEGVRDADEVLPILRKGDLLKRMEVVRAGNGIIQRDIKMRARLLAGEKGGESLVDFLYVKFNRSLSDRITFYLAEIIHEARQKGINFEIPVQIDPEGLSQIAKTVLAVTQLCQPYGIPLETFLKSLDCENTWEKELAPLLQERVLRVENGLCFARPLHSQVSADEHDVSKVLSALLDFIDLHKHEPGLKENVLSCLILSQRSLSHDPAIVREVFPRLDKHIKKLGDKHLVLQCAQVSIKAANRREQRGREAVEAEIKSLICGVSWVYQRVSKLELARASAIRAFDLAKQINSHTALAYCIKCQGRLCRMEAENSTDIKERNSKLEESKSLLLQAIERFSQVKGTEDPEVGDCYSLLGRTYLVSGDIKNANEAVKKAIKLILDEDSKDYLDLVILRGDIAESQVQLQTALIFYDMAIKDPVDPHPDKSEMRARAFYKRGFVLTKMNRVNDAIESFDKAAEIWRDLKEYVAEANAKWEKILLVEDLPNAVFKLLKKQPRLVAVKAVELRNKKLSSALSATGSSFRTKDPGVSKWEHYVKEAEEHVAIEVIDEWD